MNAEELKALPAVVDVPTAARALGLGRAAAYQLVKDGQWPTPVFRVGKQIRIPTAPLLTLLAACQTATTARPAACRPRRVSDGAGRPGPRTGAAPSGHGRPADRGPGSRGGVARRPAPWPRRVGSCAGCSVRAAGTSWRGATSSVSSVSPTRPPSWGRRVATRGGERWLGGPWTSGASAETGRAAGSRPVERITARGGSSWSPRRARRPAGGARSPGAATGPRPTPSRP